MKSIEIQWVKAFFHPKTLDYRREKRKITDLSDSIWVIRVYTTLEPCIRRGPDKTPCADHLIRRKVSKIVVGMLDPNQIITGKGILKLRKAGIAVDLFPPDLMAELEELNQDFIDDQDAQDMSSLTCPVRSRSDLAAMSDWPPAKTASDILQWK